MNTMDAVQPQMTIRLADLYGSVITGRSLAAGIRSRIEDELRAGQIVVVDFGDVIAISPSAGDEIFAKLSAPSDSLRFENMPEPVEALARYVISNRAHDA